MSLYISWGKAPSWREAPTPPNCPYQLATLRTSVQASGKTQIYFSQLESKGIFRQKEDEQGKECQQHDKGLHSEALCGSSLAFGQYF